MKEEMLFKIAKKEFDAKLTIRNGCINAEDWEKNVEWHSSVAKPSWDTILTLEIKHQAIIDSNKYQRDRAAEYPSIKDQLDDLYHNGIDGWKATIKTTKDKYPKE